MYGCSDGVLVYGFNMGDRQYTIDYDYFESLFPNISLYAADVVKNCLGEAVYGISCGLDKETGQAIISDENKEKVKILYNKYVEYLKKLLREKDFKKKMKEIQLCFRLAVSGDYEVSNKPIILDEDWKKEGEDKDWKKEGEDDY